MVRERPAEVRRFHVLFEGCPGAYSAYVPDLPGCVATGRSSEIVERRIAEAVKLHVTELLRTGGPLPTATRARHTRRCGTVRIGPLAVRFEAERP